MLQSRSFLKSLRTQAVASIQKIHTSFDLRNSSSDSDADSDTNLAKSKKQTKDVKSSAKDVDVKLSNKDIEGIKSSSERVDVKSSAKNVEDIKSPNKNIEDVILSNKNTDVKSSSKNVGDVKAPNKIIDNVKGAFIKPPTKSKFQPYVIGGERKRRQEPIAKTKFAPKDTYNRKLQDAANAVAARVKVESKEKVASDLLNRTTQIDKQVTKQYSDTISDLISKMTVDKTDSPRDELEEKMEKVRKITMSRRTDRMKPKRRIETEPKPLHDGVPFGIFPENLQASPDVPRMPTWDTLHQRELNTALLQPPRNALQEMILWTKQGKLWKFPIDNEQGMEEEQNVHFSEHIFMERHLKGWCPKSGPVRHFMELVCVGLSKNPYLSVQEKVEHIMWFKDYFEQHKSLLEEIGAVEKPETPKQITA